MLQLISLVMLIYSYFLIQTNLPHLPRSIPTHFNAAGVADGWGSPNTLWFLLAVQAFTCAIFLIVPYVGQRFPGAVHVGSRHLSDFSPAQRARMLPLLNNMTGYMSIVMNLFFVFMLHESIQAATQPNPRIHPLFPMVLLLGGMFGIVLYYLGKFRRVAKGEVDGDPSNGLTS
ncbi:MAG TPA: DUF1648 domain-containing protein [Terriglobia bacterium]|nr:DUF1648 domain-containing protein [Terriglobia bacterium]